MVPNSLRMWKWKIIHVHSLAKLYFFLLKFRVQVYDLWSALNIHVRLTYRKQCFLQCCGSGSGTRCLFDPGIRDGKKSDPGSGINIPDPQHWFLFVGLFCPSGPGYGSTDLIESGSETLPESIDDKTQRNLTRPRSLTTSFLVYQEDKNCWILCQAELLVCCSSRGRARNPISPQQSTSGKVEQRRELANRHCF